MTTSQLHEFSRHGHSQSAAHPINTIISQCSLNYNDFRRPNAEDTARSRLRSAARSDLQVPRSKTNFGSRAFAVAGPMFWNRLPPEIRANDSLQSFKSQLKTYYF